MLKKYRESKNKKVGFLGLIIMVFIAIISVYYYFHNSSSNSVVIAAPLAMSTSTQIESNH